MKVSLPLLGRCLKEEGFVYKRMRKSCLHKRDETLFQFFKEELTELHKLEEKGGLDVFYYDETGISLSPVVPYGWQRKGETHRLSSLPSQNQTVVGFMNKACKFYGFRFQGVANSETTIKCFDDFSNEIKKKTVVVLDNASIHKSKKVMDCIPRWKEKGLFLQFIPAYSPELNIIERLWEELKYRWLNKPGYFATSDELKNAIDLIIEKIGTEYTINFA